MSESPIPHDSHFTDAEITQILRAANSAHPEIQDRVLLLLYRELHALASALMRQQRPDHTLQPTALVHEAYLKLRKGPETAWNDRNHFLHVAARAMRCILIDHARGKQRNKRQGGMRRLPLDDAGAAFSALPDDLLTLNEALEELEVLDPDLVRLVELRYFLGCTVEEAARALGISKRTAERDWELARSRLRQHFDEP